MTPPSSAVSEFVTDRLKGFSKPKQTLVITQAVRLTRHVTGRQLVSLEETFTFLCHPWDAWDTPCWRGNISSNRWMVESGAGENLHSAMFVLNLIGTADVWNTFIAHPASALLPQVFSEFVSSDHLWTLEVTIFPFPALLKELSWNAADGHKELSPQHKQCCKRINCIHTIQYLYNKCLPCCLKLEKSTRWGTHGRQMLAAACPTASLSTSRGEF